jgi:hypothetical protein
MYIHLLIPCHLCSTQPRGPPLVCLFNIFTATLHSWRVSPPSAMSAVTRDPPNTDLTLNSRYNGISDGSDYKNYCYLGFYIRFSSQVSMFQKNLLTASIFIVEKYSTLTNRTIHSSTILTSKKHSTSSLEIATSSR